MARPDPVLVPWQCSSVCSAFFEDCLEDAKHLLKQCLEGAISEEDKKSCSERQQARSKGCESSQRMTERAARKLDKPVQLKPQVEAQVREEW